MDSSRSMATGLPNFTRCDRVALRQNRRKINALEARPKHQHAGTRARHDIGHFLAAEARVNRNRDGAELRAGEKRCQPRRQIRQPQRDPVAGSYAQPLQAMRDAATLLRQVVKSDRASAIDEHRADECRAFGQKMLQRVLRDVHLRSPDASCARLNGIINVCDTSCAKSRLRVVFCEWIRYDARSLALLAARQRPGRCPGLQRAEEENLCHLWSPSPTSCRLQPRPAI